MKVSICVLLIAFLGALTLTAAPADYNDSETAQVFALERKWNDAYQHSDVGKMDELLADDFIITIEDGSTFSKAGYIARYGNARVQVDISEMSDLKVRLHGNTAVVTGAYHERGEEAGKSYEYRDRLTDVWMKVQGKWRLIASHYSLRS